MSSSNKNVVDWIAYILVIIGAVNWGLVGAFHYNLVTKIFSAVPIVSTVVFILVGLSGLYVLYTCVKGGCCNN